MEIETAEQPIHFALFGLSSSVENHRYGERCTISRSSMRMPIDLDEDGSGDSGELQSLKKTIELLHVAQRRDMTETKQSWFEFSQFAN